MPDNYPFKEFKLNYRLDVLIKVITFSAIPIIFFIIAEVNDFYSLYVVLGVVGPLLVFGFLKKREGSGKIALYDKFFEFPKKGYWQKEVAIVQARYEDIYSIVLSKNTNKADILSYQLQVQLIDSDGDYTDCLWVEIFLKKEDLFKLKEHLVSKSKIPLKHKNIVKSWGLRSSHLEIYGRDE